MDDSKLTLLDKVKGVFSHFSVIALILAGFAIGYLTIQAFDNIIFTIIVAILLVLLLWKAIPKPNKIVLGNGTEVQPPRSASTSLSIIILILILWFTQITNFDIGQFFENFTNIFNYLGRIFRPDWSYSDEVIPKVIETIQMAILGTVLGSLISLPTAYFVSVNLHAGSRFAKVLINLGKALLSLLRTFPMLVYAQLILLLFAAGSGPIVGTIAITIFTFSILTKMLYEHIETLDLGAFQAIESTGVSKAKAFTTAILPEILSVYYSFALYCFDINVRHSAILGYVGAGGIGVILRARLEGDDVEQAGMILVGIFVTVLTIEAVSKAIRRRLA